MKKNIWLNLEWIIKFSSIIFFKDFEISLCISAILSNRYIQLKLNQYFKKLSASPHSMWHYFIATIFIQPLIHI